MIDSYERTRDAARTLYLVTHSGGKYDSGYQDKVSGDLSSAEKRLRGAIHDLVRSFDVDGTDVSLPPDLKGFIRDFWPSCHIGDGGFYLAALTAQKPLYTIDTVLNGTYNLFARGESDAPRLVIMDEADHVKADWLETLAAGRRRYQPSDLVARFYERFCRETRESDAVIRGDAKAFAVCYRIARHLNSQVMIEGREDWEAIRLQVEQVAKRWPALHDLVTDTYDEQNLKYQLSFDGLHPFDRDRMLFGRDDMSYPDEQNVRRGLRVRLESSVGPSGGPANVIRGADHNSRSDDPTLRSWLGHVEGTLRRIVAYLAQVATALEAVNAVKPDYDMNRAINATVEYLGFHDRDDKGIWVQLVTDELRRQRDPKRGRLRDDSLHSNGIGYVEVERSDDFGGFVHSQSQGIPYYPEALLYELATNNVVVMMSGTLGCPSVTNFDWDCMRDRYGLVVDNQELSRLRGEIVTLTDEVNEDDGSRYETDVEFLSLPADWATNVLADYMQPNDEARARLKDLWLEVLPSDRLLEKAMKTTGSILQQGDGATNRLSQLGRILVAVERWCRSVEEMSAYAMLVVTTRSIARDSGEFKLVSDLVDWHCRRGMGWFADDVGSPDGSAVFTARASDWSDRWKEVTARLGGAEAKGSKASEEGVMKLGPTVFLVNAQAGAFSKNFQYVPHPDVLKATVTLERGHGYETGDEVDFDTTYIDMPTNRMRFGLDDGREDWDKLTSSRLVGLSQIEELFFRQEVSYDVKCDRVRRLLKGQTYKIYDLPSVCAEGARVIGQAGGRLDRCGRKLPTVSVYLDSRIAQNCDFSFLRDKPLSLTVSRIVEECERRHQSAGFPTRPADRVAEDNRLSMLDQLVREGHEGLLDVVMSAVDDGPLDLFDKERDEVLRSFLTGVGSSRPDVTADHEVAGYAYWRSLDTGTMRFAIPREGESLDAACERLRCEVYGSMRGSVREVSAEAARLPELAQVPGIRRALVGLGMGPDCRLSSRTWPLPYDFVTVVCGALGELALGELLREPLAMEGLRLWRGSPGMFERVADFEVVGPDGPTGVWIDAKNYSMSAYLASGRDDFKKYRTKACVSGVRFLAVVNLLADENAEAMGIRVQEKDGNAARMASVPYLIRNGSVDARMLLALVKLIEGEVSNG